MWLSSMRKLPSRFAVTVSRVRRDDLYRLEETISVLADRALLADLTAADGDKCRWLGRNG